jgi:hypothetical protein
MITLGLGLGLTCKALIILSVLLAWESSSFFLTIRVNRGDSGLRNGLTYSSLMLQSDTLIGSGLGSERVFTDTMVPETMISLTDVNSWLDALRFPSKRVEALKRLTSSSSTNLALSAG